MEILQPSWGDLEDLVRSATDRLTVVTPFYSEEGVTRVLDSLGTTTHLEMITRLSPSDWANGVADPEALHALLDLLPGRHSLSIVRRLHAKVYVANEAIAILGSSNLSDGGFGRSVELSVRLRDGDAVAALAAIGTACAGGRPVTVGELRAWIDDSRPSIDEARRKTAEAGAELTGPQAQLDRLLRYGTTPAALSDPGHGALKAFMDWVRAHMGLAGAEMLVRRFDNTDRQNLQGHVSQTFYAVRRFLEERPGEIAGLSVGLDGLAADKIYAPPPTLVDLWNRHLDEHALDSGPEWSYSTMRAVLPASLGGTVANGGGASGTLKRMLPLVARYIAAERPGA